MIENIKIWNEVKDYLLITLGLFLYTFGWTVFIPAADPPRDRVAFPAPPTL